MLQWFIRFTEFAEFIEFLFQKTQVENKPVALWLTMRRTFHFHDVISMRSEAQGQEKLYPFWEQLHGHQDYIRSFLYLKVSVFSLVWYFPFLFCKTSSTTLKDVRIKTVRLSNLLYDLNMCKNKSYATFVI